ncbi:MAG: PHP domain-containing protein [Candidatus Nanoarchaeia archaeon]|nr:PHP domain-containing protein [Candidatus Nanoarchaeia archaeon]
MKVDMHIHTSASPDTWTKLNVLRKHCLKKGLFPVITDHNTIKGALEYKKRYNDCIIGEEIKIFHEGHKGEITGLFLNEEIKKNIDIFEAIDKIKEQGGLVYLAHPFDKVRVRSALFGHGEFDIKNKLDIVEVYNGRVVFKKYTKKAWEYANRMNLPKASGSDAHWPVEIGRAYTKMESFDLDNPKDFLKKLRTSEQVMVKHANPFVLLVGTKFFNKFKNLKI